MNRVSKFKMKPTFAIVETVMRFEEKIIALGGVAMGNIKAQLDTKATPAQTYKMGRLSANAISPIKGIAKLTSAKFDMSSVANSTKAKTIKSSNQNATFPLNIIN